MIRRRSGRLRSYLELFRIPNVFTALADVAMGFLFVRRSLSPWPAFFSLAIASALLYTGGMVLNDVYDCARDARERPQRPLPSGRIPLGRARWLGYQMLLMGVALGWLGGYAAHGAGGWRSGAVATCLALCVWAYDALVKNSWAGPFLMGACRSLNVLLGMSAAAGAAEEGVGALFGAAGLLVAAGVGIYVTGISWYARSETTRSRRGTLLLGTGLMAAGIAALAFFPRIAGYTSSFRVDPRWVWPLAVSLLSLSILRRCIHGVVDPRPARVQAAVTHGVLSIIVLDASVCLLVSPWYWATGVLALLMPAVTLARWIGST